jgi:hypothetical protein
MTHKDVDKLVRPPRGKELARIQRQEEWVIRTTFPPRTPWSWSQYGSSDIAYWGTRRDGTAGLTPYRANASRYDSENSALYEGYRLKEAHRIDDFTVERLPSKPSMKSDMDTGGGRA